MIACFLSNISAEYYKNPSMLCRVIAKNVEDVFLRHSVVSVDTLAASGARRGGLQWCAEISRHRRQTGQKRSGLSIADEWLLLIRRIEGRCSSLHDWW